MRANYLLPGSYPWYCRVCQRPHLCSQLLFLFLAGCWNLTWYKIPSCTWSRLPSKELSTASQTVIDQACVFAFFSLFFLFFLLLFEFSPSFLNSLDYEFRNIRTMAVNLFKGQATILMGET
ncbi:UNVERIFIED_CONTAM: hypothetical protein K2H54_028088 [Gekko kuhli]